MNNQRPRPLISATNLANSKSKLKSTGKKPVKQQNIINNRFVKLDADLSRYESALADPFNDAALGARVPDMYSAPTVCFHARGTTILSSNLAGLLSALVTPNPELTFVDMLGTSISTSSATPYSNSATSYAAVTQANLAAQLSNFRVVGAGFKIRNLIPPTTATGRLIVAPLAMTGSCPGPATLGAFVVNNNTVVTSVTGVNISTVNYGFTSQLLESPGSTEITAQDVIADSLGLNAKPITADAFKFINTSSTTSINSTQVTSGSITFNASTGLIVGTGENSGDMMTGGWECFGIRGEGLPVTTACFEVQYVLHLEGTPAMPTATGAMVPTAPAVAVVNINGHNNILSRVLSRPAINLCSDLVKSGLTGFSTGGFAGAGTNMANTILAKLGMQF